ncbi:MAG: glycosyltransferase [Oleiphilus sp.]|nr:MAG: glycosyltransferase [Oleiphilus sp.]
MRILHSIASIDKRAGGPSNSVTRLSEALSAEADTQSLICTLQTHEETVETAAPVQFYPVRMSRKLGLSPALNRHLHRASSEVDLIHNHGLWMMPNLYASRAAARGTSSLVISPRGTLAPWSLQQSAWKKRAMLVWGQKRALQVADGFHATAHSEYEDIRRFGLKQPVILLPNGIDVPEEKPKSSARSRYRLVYLGRIHAQKGIEKLLAIWPELARRHEDWECVLCGPGDASYLKIVQSKVEAAGPRISLQPALYGAEKTGFLNTADLFILPSETENFGISVAEALAHEIPVVASQGAPWKEIVSRECGWWVPNRAEDYVSALDHAMQLPCAVRREFGRRGRNWMLKDYAWQTISKQMRASYQWLRGVGPQPDCVRVD